MDVVPGERWIVGVLWVAQLSMTRCTSNSGGRLAAMVARNLRNSSERCLGCSWLMILPVLASSAAKFSWRWDCSAKARQMRLIAVWFKPVA